MIADGTEFETAAAITLVEPAVPEEVIAETRAPCWAADNRLMFTSNSRPMSINPRTSNSSTGTIIANSSAAAPFSDLLNLRLTKFFIGRLPAPAGEATALLEAA